MAGARAGRTQEHRRLSRHRMKTPLAVPLPHHYAARAGMDGLSRVIGVLHASPLLGALAALAVVAAAVLLLRKPKIQREADERLSALRRDKVDQYAKPRKPS